MGGDGADGKRISVEPKGHLLGRLGGGRAPSHMGSRTQVRRLIPLQISTANPDNLVELERMARHLELGGLLGYPTETVYGLGAVALPGGIEALLALKGRGDDKPFLVLLPNAGGEAMDGLEWSLLARTLAERHWPGPLTLVLSDRAGRYPKGVRNPFGGGSSSGEQ